MKNKDAVMAIVIMYCTVSPVLYCIGRAINKPIILVTEETNNLRSFLDMFPIAPVFVDISMGLPENRKRIMEANSQAVILNCNRRVLESSKGKHLFEFIFEMMSNINSDAKICHGVPLLICNSGIPQSIEEDVFAVRIQDSDSFIRFYEGMLPFPEELPVVFDRMKNDAGDEHMEGFLPTAYFFYPYCQRNNVDFSLFYNAALDINLSCIIHRMNR